MPPAGWPVCNSATAIGAPNSPPIPPWNPTTSCSSSGCIRRKDGVWEPETRPLVDKAARAILDRQLPDGGFNIYPGGPSEVSASVKAYFALKLAGLPVDDPRMARLRERILELGGIQAANSYVKVNLSLFDLYPRQYCPSIPPEVVLLPFDFLYQMSAWTRAIVVSLSIVHAANPRLPVPEGFHLDEIWLPGASPAWSFRKDRQWLTWHNIFLSADWFLKWWERKGSKSIRQRAIEKAKEWMIERLHHSEGLGAIYPPMMYSVMALDVLGYAKDHPLRAEALRHFNNLMVDEGRQLLLPALLLAGLGYRHRRLRPGADRSAITRRSAAPPTGCSRRKSAARAIGPSSGPIPSPPAGPSNTPTNSIPISTTRPWSCWRWPARSPPTPRAQEACHRRALEWLLAMQSADGGWAAFDADNNWEFLNKVPFADHNAMLDPTCPDITGRVLEALAAHGVDRNHRAVRRGVEWLVRHQQPDGSWYGRWGVAYIYGTCFALRGLAASGESDREAHVLRARRVAALHPERRWRLGRKLRQLR